MKTLKFALSALLFCGLLSSCKKYSAGCTDSEAENYSTYAKNDDGSCMYQHSSDVTVSNWSYTAPYYETTIQWANLTQEVIDRGTISVFMVYNNNSITELPFTASYAASYASHWYYEAKAGEVKIFRYDTDLTDPGNPGTAVFRLSATWK